MRIFKISHGTDYFSDDVFATLRQQRLVSVHPATKAKGTAKQTQADLFREAEVGDVFYLCRSNQAVELMGMFTDKRPLYSSAEGHQDWVDRSYELLYSATDSQAYDKQLDKWWTPKNNSTFTEVPRGEWSTFEKAVLQPVFSVSLAGLQEKQAAALLAEAKSIEDYAQLQESFADLKQNSSRLLQELNALDKLELRKIYYSYQQRDDASMGPVVMLRKTLLEKRMTGQELTMELIDATKEEIAQGFEKDVFRAWKNPFRVLYCLLYDQYKDGLINFFYGLMQRITEDLGLGGKVSFNLVHLDGPQNQGDDRIWFAIYNNTLPSQKFAKQLHLVIHNGFEYGLYDEKRKDRSKMHQANQFNYEELIETFARYKPEILMDNSREKAYLSEFLDILEHKKQVILQGPPGTGKTYTAKKLARQLIGGNSYEEHVRLVQFHPSYTYEDFVRGISAKSEGGEIIYETENKLLATFAEAARLNWEASQKDVAELSREQKVAALLQQFADQVQDELEEKEFFKITEAVAIRNVEADAFRYTGDWKTSQRMKFKDLILAELNGVSSRQELKNLAGISGLANQHSSYFFKVLQQFRKAFAKELQQAAPVEVETPEVQPYVLIIDEINRANLPAVLGELIYALEYRNEAVESLYALDGENAIIIPENLFLIGTMNTADRSVGHIDYAIKRRFAFVEVLPNEEVIVNEDAKALFQRVAALFVKEEEGELVNSDFLAADFEYRDVQLGHSYFMLQEGTAEEQKRELELRFRYEILPILHEYVKDGLLLETAKSEIKKIANLVG